MLFASKEDGAWRQGFEAGQRDPRRDLLEALVRIARTQPDLNATGVLAAARHEWFLEQHQDKGMIR